MKRNRTDGRAPNALREVRTTRDYVGNSMGSVLIEVGRTRVICTANAADGVPAFRRNSGGGWITAEYALLPGSTPVRSQREASRGRIGGRTHEIQRLIGRSLRSIARFDILGERTVWIDCDVIEADGGTRTASITGAYIALHDLAERLVKAGAIERNFLSDSVAAVSVGKVGNELLLDLDYEEDFTAQVDTNFVITGRGDFVEVQGTAEKGVFTAEEFARMMELARKGIEQLTQLQRAALSGRVP